MSEIQQLPEDKILGIFEDVSFPEYPELGVVNAKVDTGAFSGSLHCTQIEEREKNGKKYLHFSPFDHPEVDVIARKYQIREVRNSNGIQMRYFVSSKIKIKGKVYPIRINLADRTGMKKPMLIGRRFLKKHGFLVDVARSAS